MAWTARSRAMTAQDRSERPGSPAHAVPLLTRGRGCKQDAFHSGVHEHCEVGAVTGREEVGCRVASAVGVK